MTKHLLKNFHYKPLENYYETKYVSRLISDLLYTIMADALKDSYQLRPIADTIYTEERKPIPKIIPKKKKAPFNVEAFAKECNAYVVKQERQEEQENLQH